VAADLALRIDEVANTQVSDAPCGAAILAIAGAAVRARTKLAVHARAHRPRSGSRVHVHAHALPPRLPPADELIEVAVTIDVIPRYGWQIAPGGHARLGIHGEVPRRA
jgi:hypothetical protein